MQLSQEVLQVLGHRLVGQHWAVRAVAMVTGIYSQHLTGQVTVRADHVPASTFIRQYSLENQSWQRSGIG